MNIKTEYAAHSRCAVHVNSSTVHIDYSLDYGEPETYSAYLLSGDVVFLDPYEFPE